KLLLQLEFKKKLRNSASAQRCKKPTNSRKFLTPKRKKFYQASISAKQICKLNGKSFWKNYNSATSLFTTPSAPFLSIKKAKILCWLRILRNLQKASLKESVWSFLTILCGKLTTSILQ